MYNINILFKKANIPIKKKKQIFTIKTSQKKKKIYIYIYSKKKASQKYNQIKSNLIMINFVKYFERLK